MYIPQSVLQRLSMSLTGVPTMRQGPSYGQERASARMNASAPPLSGGLPAPSGFDIPPGFDRMGMGFSPGQRYPQFPQGPAFPGFPEAMGRRRG